MNNIFQEMKRIVLTKAVAAHSTMYMTRPGEPQWGAKKYDRFAEEGHDANVWVYACINAIATAAADVPLLLYEKRGKRKVEIEEHELLDLLRKPNPYQSGRQFREEWAKYLLIGGSSFIEKVTADGFKNILELWMLRPDQVAPIPGQEEFIAGYKYRKSDGTEALLQNDQVMFYKLFNPMNVLDGVSPMKVAARNIDMDASADSWNKVLLDNGGMPPGVITMAGQVQPSTFERMNAQIKKMFGGKRNVGKVPLLTDGATYHATGFNSNEVGFKDLKLLDRIEICAAFNVPPEIVGDGQNKTYSNYKEARSSFYEETILPFVGNFVDLLNAQLVPSFGRNLIIEVDKDRIEALQENTDSKWKRINEAVKEGILSPDEGREALGYTPVGGKASKLRTPKGDTPDASDESDEEPAKNAGDSSTMIKTDDPLGNSIKSIENMLNNLQQKDNSTEEDAAFFELIEAERAPWYKSAEKLLTKRLAEEGKALSAALANDGIEGFEKELLVQEELWKKPMMALYTGTVEHFGTWNYNRLKAEYDASKGAGEFDKKFFSRAFTVAKQAIQKYIADTSVYLVTKINEITREKLRSVISEGVAAQKSFLSISKDIQKIYGDDFGPRRAITIARTEIVSASNYGAQQGALSTGLELEKKWITTLDGRQRDSHNDCHGQVRDMDKPYDVGGHPGQFPGDPKLPVGQRIKCRCAEKHYVKE